MSLEFQPNGVRHKSPTAYDSNLSIILNHFECAIQQESHRWFIYSWFSACCSSLFDIVFRLFLFESETKKRTSKREEEDILVLSKTQETSNSFDGHALSETQSLSWFHILGTWFIVRILIYANFSSNKTLFRIYSNFWSTN